VRSEISLVPLAVWSVIDLSWEKSRARLGSSSLTSPTVGGIAKPIWVLRSLSGVWEASEEGGPEPLSIRTEQIVARGEKQTYDEDPNGQISSLEHPERPRSKPTMTSCESERDDL
jgi:hypothetical protein